MVAEAAVATVVSPARKGGLRRLVKLTRLLRSPAYVRGLRYGVAAAVEHEGVAFRDDTSTVIDVGAHTGQFAMFAARRFPRARIVSLEPQPKAIALLERCVPRGRVKALAVAAGAAPATRSLRISKKTDSSSLLPILPTCTTAFPGTGESKTMMVRVDRLDRLLDPSALERPCLLKIDTQGTELEAIRGATGLLPTVDQIFVECSFIEFYEGQALVDDVIAELRSHSFRLQGMYSVVRDEAGRCLQGDLLFGR